MSETTTLVLPGDTPVTLPAGAAPLTDADEPALAPEPTGQTQAFDANPFRLEIPAVDGIDAEKITIAFAGSVELDLLDQDDLSLFNSLRLGKELDLRIAGTVTDKASPLKTDKDGVKTMTRKAKVSVHTLHVLTPEEL